MPRWGGAHDRARARPLHSAPSATELGYERNDHVLYFGAAPNQQLLPALEWCIEKGWRRFLMVRSDYVFPHIANAILEAYLATRAERGVTLVCDPVYVDLEHPVFTDVFKAISDLTRDVLLVTTGRRRSIGVPSLFDLTGTRAMWSDFLSCLRTGRAPRFTLQMAQRDLRFLEEAGVSHIGSAAARAAN